MDGHNRDQVLPLVSVVAKRQAATFGRTTSCISNPQVSLMEALKEPNHQFLSDLLAELPGSDGDPSFSVNHAYPEEKHKTLLHVAAERGDVDALRMVVAAGADPNAANRLTGQTALHAAAKEPKEEVFRVLLASGADPNAAATAGRTVIHMLAKKCFEPRHAEAALRCMRLVAAQRRVEVDKPDESGGRTALHVVANGAGEAYLPALRCLLSAGADWSLKCGDDNTIRETIKSKVGRSDFRTLEELSDGAFCSAGQSLGTAVKGSLMDMIEEAELRGDVGDAERQAEWERFQKALDEAPLSDLEAQSPGETGLLQRAAEAGLHLHVRSLLARDLDPNRFTQGTSPPVVLAAKFGNADVLRVMREAGEGGGGRRTSFAAIDSQTRSSVLHTILRKPFSDGLSLRYTDEQMDARYLDCLELLLGGDRDDGYVSRQMRKVINAKDELGNTALHYATQLWPQSVVRRLLERGANIGMKNAYSEVPVEAILPQTMEDFLNEHCMESRGDPTNKDFRVTIRYDFLAPPRDDEDLLTVTGGKAGPRAGIPRRVEGWTRNGGVDGGGGCDGEKQKPGKADGEAGLNGEGEAGEEEVSHLPPLPETEVLWTMSQSEKHRHLLKHPVITSFLCLKWKRISSAYNKNLVFYLAFVSLLTAYVFALYGGRSVRANGIVAEDCGGGMGVAGSRKGMGDVKVLWWINLILLIVLFIRELFQFGIAPRRYFFSCENCLELTLIGLTAFLLLAGEVGCHLSAKRHVAAAALVLAWSEWITMVGRHPRFSNFNIYVTMFYKVITSFVKFLAWYSFFIFAFALGFYILLHRDDGHEEGEDEYVFFNHLGLAVVKTFTMFVGELEFGDLPVETGAGYAFLLAFVFLIVVVLMNLLNGLAVSDIGAVRVEAEIHFYASQVEVVSYIESMLLGDPFNFLSNWPAFVWLRRIPACSLGGALYRVPPLRYIFHKLTGASKVLLFFDFLPDKRVTFYPNHDRGICAGGCLGGGGDDSDTYSQAPNLSQEILDSAKTVILEKSREADSVEERLARAEAALREVAEEGRRTREAVQKLLQELSGKR